MSPIPNLFLVGAPKCGTTSMYEYLRRHPQIFFPADANDYWRAKEPNHFCAELGIHDTYSIKDHQQYLNLYEGSEGAQWRGDASPYYLLSESAAERIRQFSPAARIIIMLRPPVDMMRSYHSDLLRIRLEEISDFYEAIQIDVASNRDLCIPKHARMPKFLDYLSISRFAPQVERYLREFDRDRVKIVLLEDLATAPQATFRGVLQFLGVDSSVQPDFRVHNENPRHGPLERFVTTVYGKLGMKRWMQSLVPYTARRRFLSLVRRVDLRSEHRDPRDDKLRELCSVEVERLSSLLRRDLSHWQLPP